MNDLLLPRRVAKQARNAAYPGLWVGLRHALIPCLYGFNDAAEFGGKIDTAGSLPTLDPGDGSYKFSGSNAINWTPGSWLTASSQWTVLCRGRVDTAGTTSQNFWCIDTDSATDDDRFLFAYSNTPASKARFQIRNGQTNVSENTDPTGGPMRSGIYSVLTGIRVDNSTRRARLDGGGESVSSTSIALHGQPDQLALGILFNDGSPNLHLTGNISHWYMWDRVLSDAELAVVEGNPFALVESRRPAPVATFVIPAGGGSSEGALSDSAAISDTLAATATAPAAVADSGQVSDAFAASSITPAVVAESAAASDVLAATGVVNATLTESAAISDILVGQLLGTEGVIAESAAVSDAFSATATAPATVPESATVSDTLAATATVQVAIAEASQISDVIAGAAGGQLGLIVEGAAVSDTFSATATAPAAVVESGQVGDTVAATSTVAVTLAESAVISDTLVGALGADPGGWVLGTVTIQASVDGVVSVEPSVDGVVRTTGRRQ